MRGLRVYAVYVWLAGLRVIQRASCAITAATLASALRRPAAAPPARARALLRPRGGGGLIL